LIKTQYYENKTPLDYQYTLKNDEKQKGKIGLFKGWVPVGVCGHKESGNEGEYGGCICIHI
jgi:hypothetical protein